MIGFIADLHLQQGEPETLEQAVAFLDWANGRCTQLYILGDLFEYWLGDDCPLPGLEAFDSALLALSKSGCDVVLMHGNRDFLLGEAYAERTQSRLVRADTLALTLGSKQAVLLHGDTLCTDDTSYQQARLVLRTSEWQSQFTALSFEERKQQALALRRQSQNDSADKSETIMDVSAQAVQQLIDISNADLMIHGHTHRPNWHTDASVDRIVLGDWSPQGGKVAIFENDKLSLSQWPNELNR